jgi:hypothetical protein
LREGVRLERFAVLVEEAQRLAAHVLRAGEHILVDGDLALEAPDARLRGNAWDWILG